jgi:hypothetical protein
VLHKEILNKDQLDLLPLLIDFKRTFYLVGGTAIALQLGHRRSIDFDLFKPSALNHKRILDKISKRKLKPFITRRVQEQLNLIINNVKFTFFEYPFPVKADVKLENFILMPTVLDLAAMKAYALGRRSKWKDYVDLYYILNLHCSIEEISARSSEIFGQSFSEKQFRSQLCYFDDIDFEEKIEFMEKAPLEKDIKVKLTDLATNF